MGEPSTGRRDDLMALDEDCVPRWLAAWARHARDPSNVPVDLDTLADQVGVPVRPLPPGVRTRKLAGKIKFEASFRRKGNWKQLGVFDTRQEAARAREREEENEQDT